MKKSYSITSEFARKAAIHALEELDVSAPHNVFISPLKRNRTAAQHGLYWHWVGCVANHVGEDKDAMHGQLKAMFLLPIFCRDDDEYAALYAAANMPGPARRALVKATSITRANKDQMREFLSEIEKMCANQGIRLTIPDRYQWLRAES